MTTFLLILAALVVGFVIGLFVEKKNGLVARAEKGEAQAILDLKAKILAAETSVKSKL